MSSTNATLSPSSTTPGIRWWPAILIVAGALAAYFRLHLAEGQSIGGRDSMQLLPILWLGVLPALIVWFVFFSRISPVTQLKIVAVTFACESLFCMLARVDGYGGDRLPIFSWRLAESPSERLEASRRKLQSEAPAEAADVDLTKTTPTDSPGYRGADRSGVVAGVRLARDWEASPPKQLWRQPIGFGWSAFAVVGDYCVTQEQRGENEAVVCYESRTGRERWEHLDPGFFKDRMSGNGPRATPSIVDGRVYTLGAFGVLNCLDGRNGKKIWSVNVLDDNGAKNLRFGVSTSPLVIDDKVIVAPGGHGPPNPAVIAYDKQTGKRLWTAGVGKDVYSSPHLATLAGRGQVLNFNLDGLWSHSCDTGEILWNFSWPAPDENDNVAQPVPLPSKPGPSKPGEPDRVFISSGYGIGCALLEIRANNGRIECQELWRNKNLKSKFASMVFRDGFIYGLDENILTCIDLATGDRAWKSGRYGYGQLILVDDLLIIQADGGDVALVDATPDAHRELGRIPALSARTWNNPVVSGRLLLVRNDLEAACYELPVAPASP